MADNNDEPLMPPDELSKRLNKYFESQARKRARALKIEATFIKWFDKLFPFLKIK